MRRGGATRTQQGIQSPTFRRAPLYVLCHGIPLIPDLVTMNTGAWGEGAVAPCLTAGATSVGALGVLKGSSLVILHLVAELGLSNGGR